MGWGALATHAAEDLARFARNSVLNGIGFGLLIVLFVGHLVFQLQVSEKRTC